MTHKKIDLGELLPKAENPPARGVDLFAFLNLGLVEALMNGLLDAEDAVRKFYNADNCLHVKRLLKNKAADELMSRGVQLPDLFDALSAGEARREFLRELVTMHELCLKLLEEHRSVA